MDNSRSVTYTKPVTVYVTNWGWHDYKPAARYGPLVAITRKNIDYRKTKRMRSKIIEALKDMQEDDLILLSGPNIINIEVTAVVIAKFGRMRYIYWEPLLGDYVERTTDGLEPATTEDEDDSEL
jgi:hypothetical protein